jgi:hypothetical protein
VPKTAIVNSGKTKVVSWIALHMDKATKSIQLNFVVQTRLKMEFMVKPPEPNGPKRHGGGFLPANVPSDPLAFP